MLGTPNLPIKNGFCIWFNKKEKREYFVTTISTYKSTHIKDPNFKNGYRLLAAEDVNLTKKEKAKIAAKKKSYTEPLYIHSEYLKPFEERYGMFFINFLNADFSSSIQAYKTFFVFYGIELFYEYIDKEKYPKFNDNNFFTPFAEAFKESQERIIDLQDKIKKCVDYMYNLHNNKLDENEYPQTKFLSYALQNYLYKYSNNVDIFFNNFFAYDKENLRQTKTSPSGLKKRIATGTFNYKTSNIYHSTYLSNIVFMCLNELAMNTNIIIKTCQHCGKYFIPVSKESEIYCDIIYYYKEKPCRITGAAETFKKGVAYTDAYNLYKKTYQKILMQIQRGTVNPVSEKGRYFDGWKSQAQTNLKKYKKGTLTEQQILDWMQESIKKFDILPGKLQ